MQSVPDNPAGIAVEVPKLESPVAIPPGGS